MSCIYGPRQFGTEDQGWVAHFILRALRGERITLYGDGMQVRDILFIDDLVAPSCWPSRTRGSLAGRAFNIGGGPGNAISLLDLLDRIEAAAGPAPVSFDDWRTGDQRYYVSDTRAFQRATGWRPRVRARDGIARLYDWLQRQSHAGRPAACAAGRGRALMAGMQACVIQAPGQAVLQDAPRRSPARARCWCGSRARACARPACRCGKAASGSTTRSRGRPATKAGAAWRRWAPA
jgi:hypothetical protein